jgi:pimeloyl-ACP methyl ester carboxylesterase
MCLRSGRARRGRPRTSACPHDSPVASNFAAPAAHEIAIADATRLLLARSGITGPVVLVGESIAGFNVRMFASDHPEHAVGLVQVDASHEDDAHEVLAMARFVPLLSTIGAFRLLGVSFGRPLNRWLHQFANSRARRCSSHRDTTRRPTTSFTLGKPCRKSGARAAGSRFLSCSSLAHGEPTRTGDGCNTIKRRCQNEDV